MTRSHLLALLAGACLSCGGGGGYGEADVDLRAEEEWEAPTTEPESDACGDDTYTATVDYFNPETGYTNTYTLDVEVSDGSVGSIYFPNGGWITGGEELDDEGKATVTDDEGRTYDVTIDDCER